LTIPKETQKVLFYKWLTDTSTNHSSFKQDTISNLFKSNKGADDLVKTQKFMSSLFNLTSTLRKSTSSIDISDFKNNNRTLSVNNEFSILDLVVKPKSRFNELHNQENDVSLRLLNSIGK